MSWPSGSTSIAAACLILALIVGAGGFAAAASLEPGFAPGTSALDALAALREAEERTYSLPGAGLKSLAVRVRSPQIEQLARTRSDLVDSDLQFVLWWEAPDRRQVTLAGTEGRLEPALVDALTGLVQPLHELLLPVPPTQRLRGHAFVFAEPPEHGSRRCIVEARARDLDDPRRLARFTIDDEGVIVREQSESATGDVSDYHHAYARSKGRLLLVGVTGSHRGARVDLTLHWGAEVGGRPVPTRVTARQLDGLGRPQGPIAEIEYRLSGHRLDERLPDGLWPPPPTSRSGIR